MTAATYWALHTRIAACTSLAALEAVADEVKRAYAGDPQLADVLRTIRMTVSAFRIEARQRDVVRAEAERAAGPDSA